MRFRLLSTVILLALSFHYSYACTSVIISGKHTLSGKPVMLKHRDSGELENRVERYSGPVYSFIGIVNSFHEEDGVWTGVNSVGFSIMNTASYNIKNDDVPSELMDKEGLLMFKALGICADLSDFETMLDTLSRPLGVEANFGVIDAFGGAAYYEVNNDSWIKFDVNEIPSGYRVVTNFSESGRKEDYKGYERYLSASSLMEELFDSSPNGIIDADHETIFNKISRSYFHSMTGIDYLSDYDRLEDNFGFKGVVIDQDFIPRRSTSCSIVIEGVETGENPLNTVMWTMLGYPPCSVYFPLLVMDEDIIPSFMKKTSDSLSAPICSMSLNLKNSTVFRFEISNGEHYLDLSSVREILSQCRMIESSLDSSWQLLYDSYLSGKTTMTEFKNKYSELSSSFFDEIILKLYSCYL